MPFKCPSCKRYFCSSKVGIAGVLLQEDTSESLRPCAYWARKRKDCEIRYNAYDFEALPVVKVVSRVWRVYLLGCKYFPVVIDYATLTHLLKQPSNKLTNRQVSSLGWTTSAFHSLFEHPLP